jgi:hypothetical protein
VDSESRFADTSLLIEYGDDFGHGSSCLRFYDCSPSLRQIFRLVNHFVMPIPTGY